MEYVNRNGHASLSVTGVKSRKRKASKVFSRIIASSGVTLTAENLNILEIGCGTGHLSALFARNFPNAKVFATDIENRLLIDAPRNLGFDIVPPAGEFPFEDYVFDLIILNQVLEHVIPKDRDPLFEEICRLLKKEGHIWLAFPNKFALIEPHYYIPFLSILPKKIADSLVGIFQMGKEYDCFPLSPAESVKYFSEFFNNVENQTVGTVKFLFGFAKKISSSKKTGELLSNFSPVLVFLLKNSHE